MNYKYITATGTVEIEANDEWINALIALDRKEIAQEQKEKRHRAFYLSDVRYENETLCSINTEPLTEIEKQERSRHFNSCFALLTELQKQRLQMMSDGLSINEIAKIEGKDPKTVFESVKAARKKFKKVF